MGTLFEKDNNKRIYILKIISFKKFFFINLYFSKNPLKMDNENNNGVSASSSGPSVNTYAQTGTNTSVGVDATLTRNQINVGPAEVGTGLNLDTNASIGENGVGATLLGTGFQIGRKVQLKTPFGHVGFKLFWNKFLLFFYNIQTKILNKILNYELFSFKFY